jgi:uncharacterized protein (DUF362 family)
MIEYDQARMVLKVNSLILKKKLTGHMDKLAFSGRVKCVFGPVKKRKRKCV